MSLCKRTEYMHIKLLAMVPQPVKAVVLLFPITSASEKKKVEEDEKTQAGTAVPVDPTVIWIKQTVCPSLGV